MIYSIILLMIIFITCSLSIFIPYLLGKIKIPFLLALMIFISLFWSGWILKIILNQIYFQ